MGDGLRAHFLFVKPLAERDSWIREALEGLGYELVDVESSRSGLMRIFIDSPRGINVEDCARVSNHLTRAFAVEGGDAGNGEQEWFHHEGDWRGAGSPRHFPMDVSKLPAQRPLAAASGAVAPGCQHELPSR